MEKLEKETKDKLASGTLSEQEQAAASKHPAQSIDEYTVPVLFDPERGTYLIKSDETHYTLTYGTAATSYLSDYNVADASRKSKDILKVVTANISNDSTVDCTGSIFGSDKAWQTPLKDVCSIFTKSDVTSLLKPAGISPAVELTSSEFDSNFERTSGGMVEPVSNECTRFTKAVDNKPAFDARLRIDYAKSTTTAESTYSNYTNNKPRL